MDELAAGARSLTTRLMTWWTAQTRPRRTALLGVAAGLVLALSLGAALATNNGANGGGPGEVVVTAPTATATDTPSATETATATPVASRWTPDDEPDAPIVSADAVGGAGAAGGGDGSSAAAHHITHTSLERLVADHGYPAGADYARIRIPVLGVDAQVLARSVGAGQQMPESVGPADVVWYDLRGLPGMGGAPGAGGNAIFGGHVDWYGRVAYAPDVHYRGLAVFGRINRLSGGEVIEIDHGGRTLRYQVVWQRTLSANAGGERWAEIWRSTPGVDEITLITCGGAFNASARSYADRIVVRAERI